MSRQVRRKRQSETRQRLLGNRCLATVAKLFQNAPTEPPICAVEYPPGSGSFYNPKYYVFAPNLVSTTTTTTVSTHTRYLAGGDPPEPARADGGDSIALRVKTHARERRRPEFHPDPFGLSACVEKLRACRRRERRIHRAHPARKGLPGGAAAPVCWDSLAFINSL